MRDALTDRDTELIVALGKEALVYREMVSILLAQGYDGRTETRRSESRIRDLRSILKARGLEVGGVLDLPLQSGGESVD